MKGLATASLAPIEAAVDVRNKDTDSDEDDSFRASREPTLTTSKRKSLHHQIKYDNG